MDLDRRYEICYVIEGDNFLYGGDDVLTNTMTIKSTIQLEVRGFRV